MEAHRPEPEESWQDRQFDEQHRQVLDLLAVSGQLPPLQINDKEYKDLMKVLYPKDNSKKFRR